MEQDWSSARCHYTIYFLAMICDRTEVNQETMAFEALVRRAPEIKELSEQTLSSFREQTESALGGNGFDELRRRAVGGLNPDQATARSVYANCADIVRADGRIRPSESRFMNDLARSLRLAKRDRALIDRVMDAKNRH